MKVTAYPEYKDSGTLWLGDVPAHWDIWPSRRLFRLRTERAHEEDEQLTASQRHGVIPQKTFMELENQKVVQVVLNREILKHVKAGDFVISMRSFQGGIEFSAYSGCVSSAYTALVPTEHVHPVFFQYLLKSTDYIQALQSTTNLVRDGQALRFQNFCMVPLPVTTWEEQEAIVNVLNAETSKVDRLVADLEAILGLLDERRTEMIDHVVKRGLNNDCAVKPSAVEWIGECPEHWNVWPSRRLFQLRNERAHEDDEQLTASQRHGVIPQKKFMELENTRVVQVVLNREILKHVEAGDFVISMRSFQGGIEYSAYSGCVSSAYVTLVPNEVIHPPFYKYLLKSRSYIEALQSTTNLVRDGQALRFKNFAMVDLPLPSMPEQQAIAKHLDSEVASIDELKQTIEQLIGLLQERRTALISSAVTGKIDVREFATEEPVE